MKRLFRDGCPRWSIIAGLLALPPLCAAPVTVVLKVPLWLSLAVGFSLTATVIWLLGDRLPVPTLSRPKRALAALLAFAACAALYSRPFGGLPNWVSSDAGNHAAILRELVGGLTSTYGGCVSMHIAWYLVDRLLHLNAFWSFAVIFYALVALFAVLPLSIGFMLLAPFEGSRRAWTAGAITTVVSLLVGLGLIALPILHYLQVEGFYTQLFALLPLLLLWWLDVAIEPWWVRLILWALGVAAFRYTNGLNLVELIAAFSVVMVVDVPSRLRPWAIVTVAGPFLVGSIVLKLFNSTVGLWGWFVAYDIKPALEGGLFALAAMALAAAVDLLLRARLGLARAMRLPLLFCAGSFAIANWYRGKLPRSYYVLKYPLLAICLAEVAFAVLLGVVAARLVEQRRVRDFVWSAGALASLVAATVLWWTTFPGYRTSYWERVRGSTSKELRPLADLDAWRRIDTTLEKQKKKFGGYLVSYGPMSNFMNSAMGIANGQKFYFEGRAPKEGPGYCVFWDGTHPDPWPDFNRWYRHRWIVDRLERDKARQCEDYMARWDTTVLRRLCHLCK